MGVGQVRRHRQPGRLEGVPLDRVEQRGNGHQLAPVEAGQGGVHQFIHIHGSVGIEVRRVAAGALPNLGARGARKHRLQRHPRAADLLV